MPPAIEEEDINFQKDYESSQSPEFKTEPATRNSAHHNWRVKRDSAMAAVTSTPTFDRILAYPVLREIPFREGLELSGSQIDACNRTQQKGALLLITRGDVQPQPCRRCANGNGRFTECIAIEGLYRGSCATCVFLSRGSKCSLRFQTGNDDSLQEEISEPEAEVPVPKKRKRRSTAKVLENANGGARTHKRSRSAEIEAQLQAQLAQEDQNPIEYLNVVHKKHKNDISAPSPILPPKQSPILPPSHLPSPYHGGNINPHYSKPAVSRSQHESWAVPPPPQNGSRESGGFTPVQSTSSHTARPPPPFSAPTPVPASHSASISKYESTSGDVPIIDTLPKAKQRQIYSVISGMQGGIDHLEKQLNSLKTMLGIPDDDAMG